MKPPTAEELTAELAQVRAQLALARSMVSALQNELARARKAGGQ